MHSNRMGNDVELREIGELIDSMLIGRICIWGFALPSDHTHHWIHAAFHQAFTEILQKVNRTIEICWLDATSAKPSPARGSTLFLTACDYSGNRGIADEGLPIDVQDWYCVHQGWSPRATKYQGVASQGRCVFFEEYRISKDWPADPFVRIQPDKNTIIFPWASDLMPWAIMERLAGVPELEKTRRVQSYAAFVGSVWEQNSQEFIQLLVACAKRQMMLHQRGSFVKSELLSANEDFQKYSHHCVIDKRPASMAEHASLIRSARMAPAVQGAEQIGTYVADRVLKNCSYGTLGITNNPLVAQLLGDCVVFATDIDAMVEHAREIAPQRWIEMTSEGMIKVAQGHTYLQRILGMLRMLASK